MFGLEASAVVAQPDVVAALTQEESEAIVVVTAVRACALQEAMDHQDGVFPLAFSRSAWTAVGRDMGEVLVGEYLGRSVGPLGC